MAILHWRNGLGGDFGLAANWDLGFVPTAADIAIIDAAGTYTVTIATATAVQSLVLNDAGATVVDSANLTVGGALTLTAGTFNLAAGGVVSGGVLSATGGHFAWNGGTLSGVTYQGTLDLTAAGATLSIANGLKMTGAGGVGPGTINANGAATSLTFLGTQTLDNAIINAGNPAGGATAIDFGDLTLGANTTLIQGGNTLNGISSWSIDIGTSLTNNGTIQTGQANGGADIVTTTLVNNGLITSTSPYAGFSLQATNLTNNGTIGGTGGIGISATNFTNNGLVTDNGGVAANVTGFTNNGIINLAGYNTYLAIIGNYTGAPAIGMTGTGTINMTGSLNDLRLLYSESLQSGTINLSGTGEMISTGPLVAGGTNQLIFGAQTTINHLAGTTQLGGWNDTFNGTINASGATGLLTINPQVLAVNGSINVSGGDHVLLGSPVTGTGQITLASGGTAEFASLSASTDTVVFKDTSSATLRLDLGAAGNFKSGIQGFTNGNTIDLSGIAATSATWANGLLTVAGSGWGMTGPITLAMPGNYSGATFHIASDGILAAPPGFGFGIYPGSNITVTGASAPPPPPPPRTYSGTGAALSGAEGSATAGLVATFHDSNLTDTAGQFSASIAWGDGTTSTGMVTGSAGTFTVADVAGHVYGAEGTFATSIAITNSADHVTTTLAGTATATEADVFTVVPSADITATAGQTVGGTLATFTDSFIGNVAGDFSATIDWGDGTASLGVVTDVNGVISVAGDHSYAAAGVDQVTVTLADLDGTASAASHFNAIVTNPVPATGGATGLTVLSVSTAGIGPYGVWVAPTVSSNSATALTVPGSISASSAATASDSTTAASISVNQTTSAAWTTSSTGTATFQDNWSSLNVQSGGNNGEASFGLQAGPGYTNATFSVDLTAAGTFNVSWSALWTSTGPTGSWSTYTGPNGGFGLMNMVISVDGVMVMQVPNPTIVQTTGQFAGALSAGAHTISFQDWSNYSGAQGTSSGSLTETLNLTVNGGGVVAPPSVYGGTGATVSLAEGSAATVPLATFTDSNAADAAGQFSATIDWGDGTVTVGTVTGGNGVFSVTDTTGHVYAAESTYATTVTVTNALDGVATALTGAVTAIEADVFGVTAAPAIAVTAGLAYAGTVATFSDSYAANSAGDFSATIDWGDGTTSLGTVTAANGAISVAGAHTYAKVGADVVSVTLTDIDGTASATATGSATVKTPYGGTGATIAAKEGSAVTGAVASFTDAIATDVAGGFSATIAWGDGTTSAGTVSGSNGVFSVNAPSGHVYASEGSYAVTTTVTHTADGANFALTGGVTAAEADVFTVVTAPAIAAIVGTAFNGVVATFSDSYIANTASDLTASIVWGDGTTSTGTVTDVNGAISVTGSHTYATAGTDAVSVTLKDKDGSASATAAGSAAVAAAPVAPPGTLYLTVKQDNVLGGAANDTIVAATNTLSNGDVINGGAGVNTLQLSGGGVFNLPAVDKFANIQIVAAQEGVGAAAQVVTLREFTSFQVNVASDPAHDPAAGITIIGAQNTDTINLGTGNDTVIVGVGETVNGGGGNAVYKVNQDTIGNTINGGATGTNTLVLTSGGTMAMGTKITGMTAVQLTAKTTFTANATPNMTIAGSAAGGDTITLGAASQSVISGGAGEKIKATAANAGALISGVGAGSSLEITSGGTVAMNAATSVASVKLDAATNLSLSKMSFITVAGSSGADTITAGASYQTLSGGGGADLLMGFAGGYDTFSDKASGLNGDTIGNFLASDQIDVTDLAFAGAALKVAASGANTLVTLTSGATKSAFTLAGSFSAAGFHMASDGAAGTVLTHI